jgi:Kinesin motor domain
MQRSFEYIYDQVDRQRKIIEAQQSSHFESLIRCSYLEIYNEQIMDLLDPT